MDKLDHTRTEFLDQETVVRWALEATDRSLFETDGFEEEDSPILHDRVRRAAATPRSTT